MADPLDPLRPQDMLVPREEVGKAGGVAGLDDFGHIPVTQLPDLSTAYAPASIVPVPVTAIDLTSKTAKKRGVPSMYESALLESAAFSRAADGSMLIQRATTNVHPSPTFAGAVVGVVNFAQSTPGRFPTGWALPANGSSIAYEVLSVTPDNIRIKMTRAATTGTVTTFGIRTSAAPGAILPAPTRGGYTLSATLGIVSATADVKQVKLSLPLYNPPSTTLVTERTIVQTVAEGTRRVAVWSAVTDGQAASVSYTVEMVAPTNTDIEVIIDIGRPQLEDASSADDVTAFTATTRPAGAATVRLLPGDYSILIAGPQGGTWYDVTVTGQTNWPVPVGDGTLAAGRIHVFNRIPVAVKDAAAESLYPTVFTKAPTNQGTEVRYSGKVYRLEAPATPYAAAVANKKALLRFEVGPGDRAPSDITSGSTNERSELVTIDSTRAVPYDTDVWASYAMLIEDNPTEGRAFAILGQWHSTSDANDGTMSPILHLTLTDTGALQITTRSGTEAVSTPANTTTRTLYNDPAYPRGVWVRWVYRVRFSKTGGGQLQAWRNGVEVYVGSTPIGYNDAVGPYWQFGVYAATSTTNRLAVQYANVETGTASLLDRVANPKPIA